MSYAVTTTTRTATVTNGLQNLTEVIVDNMNMTRMVFATYDAADAFARDYANARGAAYVKPATEAPRLSEGESYVEVVTA